jgi:T5orf172 domain
MDPELRKYPAGDEYARDSDDEVGDEAKACTLDDLARKPAGGDADNLYKEKAFARAEAPPGLDIKRRSCDRASHTTKRDEPNAGWVYILATREAPLFLKIGMTTRSVEERVREINSATGVLVPFGIWRCWRVMQPAKAEKLVHTTLAGFRVRGDREFFAVEVSEAGKRISQVLEDAELSLRTLDNLAALAN